MKILISAAGSHGDVLPFIALAREFMARGHMVILYINPFFGPLAVDAGVQFVAIGTVEAYASLFGELSETNPRKAFKRVAIEFAEICGLYYKAMEADIIAGSTIVIGSSLLFAPRLLQETHDVRCATVHLAPSVFRSNHSPARLIPAGWINADSPTVIKGLAWWYLDKFFYDPSFTVPLNRLRAALGLPAVERIFDTWIHQADCVVGLFPEWFAAPQPDWPKDVEFTGFPLYDKACHAPLADELEEFIAAGAPPVAFSAGTATSTANPFFKTSVEACRIGGFRGIMVSHFADQVPRFLPDGVIHVNYAPFSTLLPRLGAFVHHGGIGATSQALRAGVPQLIRPSAYDQFDNAQRAVQLGVAREILPGRYKSHAVATALTELTSDMSLRRRCQETSRHFDDANPIAAACDAILGGAAHVALAGNTTLAENRFEVT
jgi:UDP:flavonoid glycosyltransferase YjiC (YdhE family)